MSEILQYFEYQHLPKDLQAVSRPFCELAHALDQALGGPELEACLRKLLEAKDCAVRAAVTKEPTKEELYQEIGDLFTSLLKGEDQ